MTNSDSYQGDDLSFRERARGHVYTWWSVINKMLFIIGTIVLIFACLSNTLTCHLQQFWGASGDFWQHQWNKILITYGNDNFKLFVFGANFVAFIVYWSLGFLYTFIDLTGFPKFIKRYKIQPGTNEPVDTVRLLKLMIVVFFNQIISLPFSAMCFFCLKLRGFNTSFDLPTFHWVLFELAIFILAEEVCFYYSHRLFHHRFFYKKFHKLHHEWQSPISLTAAYCHPLEHIFSNVLPIFMGPMIMGSHIATVWLWVSLAIFSTLNAHSGYHLPFFPSPEAHDFHHLKFNQCYGVLGVLDLLHGTDDKFRSSKSFSRHIMMLSFVPPREEFPDDIDDIKQMAWDSDTTNQLDY